METSSEEVFVEETSSEESFVEEADVSSTKPSNEARLSELKKQLLETKNMTREEVYLRCYLIRATTGGQQSPGLINVALFWGGGGTYTFIYIYCIYIYFIYTLEPTFQV